METRFAEIADGLYRLSTFVPEIAPPAGFTYNQFLVLGDEPLLFHTGLRRHFPLVRDGVARILPPERLRWIAFGHYEADECGAMNEWLAVAPRAQVAHGQTACLVSLNDMADRAPRILADGEVVEIGGGRRLHRHAARPARLGGRGDAGGGERHPALRRPVHPGRRRPCPHRGRHRRARDRREDLFRYSSLSPGMGATIRRLAGLAPKTLALMHGPSFAGDGVAALRALADDYDRRVRAALT
jgi:hypothetical protein